jgi:hypothetical protein
MSKSEKNIYFHFATPTTEGRWEEIEDKEEVWEDKDRWGGLFARPPT